jgi:hypothetical protein
MITYCDTSIGKKRLSRGGMDRRGSGAFEYSGDLFQVLN